MAWSYKKSGAGWIIYRTDTGAIIGHSASEEKAKALVREAQRAARPRP